MENGGKADGGMKVRTYLSLLILPSTLSTKADKRGNMLAQDVTLRVGIKLSKLSRRSKAFWHSILSLPTWVLYGQGLDRELI